MRAAGGGHLLSLYERKSRTGILVKLMSKDADDTALAMIRAALEELRVHAITYDNGFEFSSYQQVSDALGAAGYFCRPYHSWEKGGFENFNGLVRQYFPKETNFLNVSEAELNGRLRKCLGFPLPNNLKHKLAA